MKKKLMRINLSDLSQTTFVSPREHAMFIVNKRVGNFPIFLVEGDKMTQIVFPTTNIVDIEHIMRKAIT